MPISHPQLLPKDNSHVGPTQPRYGVQRLVKWERWGMAMYNKHTYILATARVVGIKFSLASKLSL
jgi:hypothetical protein